MVVRGGGRESAMCTRGSKGGSNERDKKGDVCIYVCIQGVSSLCLPTPCV